jgi:putative zinc finger protein
MARCEDMKLLLGPFEDGELEPHEMQEVARHLAGCTECEGELADYGSLAVSLRGAAVIPDLTGFTTAVLARIAELPIPIRARVRRYFTSFADGIGATIATGFAAATVAVITTVVLTPYFKQAHFNFNMSGHQEVASTTRTAPAAAPRQVAKTDPISPDIAKGLSDADALGDNGGAIHPVEASSGAIIDRLEADSPSVAVWSEPQSDTTVIWVPDQSR